MSWFESEEGEKYDPEAHEFHPDSEGVRQELERISAPYGHVTRNDNYRPVHEQDDGSLTHKINGEHVPITHVYRAVSEPDFHRMREQGYLDTHGHGNMYRGKGEDAEGMVASSHPFIHGYVPYEHGGGRVLKIRVRPEDGWRAHHVDGPHYVQTPSHDHPIPWDRVEDHTERMEVGTNPSSWNRDHVRLATEPDKPKIPWEHSPVNPQRTAIRYVRNPESSAQHGDFGEQYGQHIEPAGRYITERGEHDRPPEGWETGEVHFRNPLHIPFGGSYREPSNWKHQLHQRYDGKTGHELSRAIVADGHDGIVTHDDYGTAEIVDLTHLHQGRTAVRGETMHATEGGYAGHRSPDDLFEFTMSNAVNPHFWKHHAAPQQVSLKQPIYATQRDLVRKHVERYLADPESPRAESTGSEHPMLVKHQGRVHVLEGHHRVSAELLRGSDSIHAHYYDADRRGFPPGMDGNEEYRNSPWGRVGARTLPHERLFGPTYGLDHRLFDGERLKPDVRRYVLGTLGGFWAPRYGQDWQEWSRVYLAGSEASEWTSPSREGNNDFDVLVGVDYNAFRRAVLSLAGLSDEAITARMNAEFRTGLIPRTDPTTIVIDGQDTGPWSNTFYVNANSYDIRDIKPYAAYDITANAWAVKPPHLPSWSIEDFPQGHPLVQECQGYASVVRSILGMPEPYRSQQADALWRHLHGDRSRAFGPNGEGWYDSGNVIEKFLDQSGLWEPLAQAHFDAVAEPSKLLAPAGWSNDPR